MFPQIVSFIINLGVSYLLGRLTAKDGPRLDNKEAAGGEYGVGMPRLYGEKVRATGIFIAQDDIKETKHSDSGSGAITGALTGAAIGFMYGGPVGTIIGGVLGGIFGASTAVHYYTYSDTFAVLLADRLDDDPIEGAVKGWAGGKVFFKSAEGAGGTSTFGTDGKLVKIKYPKNRFYKSLTLYTGHVEQGVDPVLAATVDEDGSYPRIAYAVIEDLQLEPFGQSVPIAEFLVSVETGQSVAAAIEKMCLPAGIDNVRDISTTALNDDILRGYPVTDPGTLCWDAVKPLLPAFAVDAAEVAGQLRFFKRAQTMQGTIPANDMGAYIYGDSPPPKFTFQRNPDLGLPRETSLTFIDPARDYQQNTATSRRSEGDAKSNVAVSVPLVLTADEGASAAALLHWDAHLGRSHFSTTLTDAWISMEVGRAYAIPIGEQYVPYRITRRTRGANGITEVEALSDESVTYSASITGASGTIPDDESTLFADTRLVLMDMAILEDAHDDYGFYIVMAGSQPYWTRAAIKVSSGGDFVTIIDDPFSAIIGDVTGTLAAGTTTGLDDTLDTTSVLTVVLLHSGMELESATDAELDAHTNFAFVGKDGLGEYIQFKTATFISGTTWELSNLRRGRKGTDFAIGTHASGEEFALLGGEGVFRIIYSDESQWGSPLDFKGVTLHQDDVDAATVSFTNTGEGKRPYSSVNVTGSWDGSNNLTMAWDARSRLNAGGLAIDDQDNYEVEIITGAGRTITATGVETAAYSAADQATDTITPGDSISGRVRQLSDVNDGRWRSFTLSGPNDALFDTTHTTFDGTTPTWDSA